MLSGEVGSLWNILYVLSVLYVKLVLWLFLQALLITCKVWDLQVVCSKFDGKRYVFDNITNCKANV